MPQVEPVTRKEMLETMILQMTNSITEWSIDEKFLQRQLFSSQVKGSEKPIQQMLGQMQGKINAAKSKLDFLKEELVEELKK